VVIGENCLLCAQVAIAGKTIIGNNVILYGKVGISKGLVIGDNAVILASSNVDKNLEGGKRYYGSPALEARQAMKYFATLRMMPEYLTKIRHLLYQEEKM
jgi:UDP-3-O-[3-hydroxymyristoyl] glucosamine N-acyltransferase